MESGLSIELVMKRRDEGEAGRATGALERVLEDALRATGFASAITAPILRRLSLEARGPEVRASLELTNERLEAALDIIIAIWDTPPARDEPERAPAPEPDEIIRRQE